MQIMVGSRVAHLPRGISCPRRARLGDAFRDNGIGAYDAIVGDGDISDDLCTTSYKNAVAYLWRAMAVVAPLSANGDIAEDFAVAPNLSYRRDDHLSVR